MVKIQGYTCSKHLYWSWNFPIIDAQRKWLCNTVQILIHKLMQTRFWPFPGQVPIFPFPLLPKPHQRFCPIFLLFFLRMSFRHHYTIGSTLGHYVCLCVWMCKCAVMGEGVQKEVFIDNGLCFLLTVIPTRLADKEESVRVIQCVGVGWWVPKARPFREGNFEVRQQDQVWIWMYENSFFVCAQWLALQLRWSSVWSIYICMLYI